MANSHLLTPRRPQSHSHTPRPHKQPPSSAATSPGLVAPQQPVPTASRCCCLSEPASSRRSLPAGSRRSLPAGLYRRTRLQASLPRPCASLAPPQALSHHSHTPALSRAPECASPQPLRASAASPVTSDAGGCPCHHGHTRNPRIRPVPCRIRGPSGSNTAERSFHRRAASEGPDGRAHLDPSKEGERAPPPPSSQAARASGDLLGRRRGWGDGEGAGVARVARTEATRARVLFAS